MFYIVSDVKNPFLVLILHKLQNLSSFVFLHCLIYKVHAAAPLGDSLFILPRAVRFVKNFFQLSFGSLDLSARNRLVEHNLRLVAHIIKKYYTQAANQEDLISIGTIGLIKAVNTFQPDKKIRLATYASRCIENAILT